MKIAVFTILNDEKEYFERWYKWYSRQLPDAKLFVIFHRKHKGQTVPKWLRDAKVKVFTKHHKVTADHRWMRVIVSKIQNRLIRNRDYVVFSEVDELLVFDPKVFTCLREAISSVSVLGRITMYEPVQLQGETNILGTNLKALFNRRLWIKQPNKSSKVLVTNKPVTWTLSYRAICGGKGRGTIVLHGLRFVHLRRVDKDFVEGRHELLATQPCPRYKKNNHINRYTRDFEEWYHEKDNYLEEIPERFKDFSI